MAEGFHVPVYRTRRQSGCTRLRLAMLLPAALITAAISPKMIVARADPVANPPTVTIDGVAGEFYSNPTNSGTFDASQIAKPLFAESFPTIDFNPPTSAQVFCSNATGVNEFTRPYTDVLQFSDGSCGTLIAQGSGLQAGVGALNTFEATFISHLEVSTAATVTFNFYSDDGWVLGIGQRLGGTQQPSYVSGPLVDPPGVSSANPAGVTPQTGLPVVGSYNLPSSPTLNQLTVAFPAAGSYPIEVDYTECCGGQLALTIGTTAANPIPPTTPPPPPNGASYVAFGDSIPTGFTAATCNRASPTDIFYPASLNDCSGAPPATPYPSLVASGAPNSGLGSPDNVAVFGYSAVNADEVYSHGYTDPFWPEYAHVAGATTLVTGALGINDISPDSSIPAYLVNCYEDLILNSPGACILTAAHYMSVTAPNTVVPPYQAIHDEMNLLHAVNDRGADVAIPLYYNPYTENDSSCELLHLVADVQTKVVNQQLERWYPSSPTFQYVDTDPLFEGHRVGDASSWLSGKSCSIDDFINAFLPPDLEIAGVGVTPNTPGPHGAKAAAILIDVHPTQPGQQAIAQAIIAQLGLR